MFSNLHFRHCQSISELVEMEICKHIPTLHFHEMVEFDHFRNGLAVAELELCNFACIL